MFQEAYQFVIEQLGKNDLVAGGAVLAVLAYLLNQARAIPATLIKWSRLLFVTHLDIPDRSDSFEWVSDWVAQHDYSKKSKRITLEVKDGKGITTPAPGNHLVWWGRRPIILKRVRREGTGDNAHRAFRESWELTMIGRRSHVVAYIEECRKLAFSVLDKSVLVSDANPEGYWSASRTPKRPIESVICPEKVSESLMRDITDFINSKEWYSQMNIPWTRGYLLSGPPGNGKSSLVKAIASEFDFKIHSINLNKISESDLSSLAGDVRKECILLLEDIDCAFDDRENKTSISMSSMLNMLDGISTCEGRLVFMTTNHPEKLDPALIRPGRIDLHVELPNPTQDQIAQLFDRFFPKVQFRGESYDPAGVQFAKRVMGKGISMAKLQGYLLKYRHTASGAMNHIKDLIE